MGLPLPDDMLPIIQGYLDRPLRSPRIDWITDGRNYLIRRPKQSLVIWPYEANSNNLQIIRMLDLPDFSFYLQDTSPRSFKIYRYYRSSYNDDGAVQGYFIANIIFDSVYDAYEFLTLQNDYITPCKFKYLNFTSDRTIWWATPIIGISLNIQNLRRYYVLTTSSYLTNKTGKSRLIAITRILAISQATAEAAVKRYFDPNWKINFMSLNCRVIEPIVDIKKPMRTLVIGVNGELKHIIGSINALKGQWKPDRNRDTPFESLIRTSKLVDHRLLL